MNHVCLFLVLTAAAAATLALSSPLPSSHVLSHLRRKSDGKIDHRRYQQQQQQQQQPEQLQNDPYSFAYFPIMTRMQMWQCNRSWVGQGWYINETDRSFRLIQSPGNCAETFGASNTSGNALVDLWVCPSTQGNMRFRLREDGESILEEMSGLCLGWEGPTPGSITQLYNCSTGQPSQYAPHNVRWNINSATGEIRGPQGTEAASYCLSAGSWIPEGPIFGNGYMESEGGMSAIYVAGLYSGTGGAATGAGVPGSHITPAHSSAVPSVYSLHQRNATVTQTFTDDSTVLTTTEYMQRDNKNVYVRVVDVARRPNNKTSNSNSIVVPLARYRNALNLNELELVNRTVVQFDDTPPLVVSMYQAVAAEVPGVSPRSRAVTVESSVGLDDGSSLTLTIPAGSNAVQAVFPMVVATDLDYDLYARRVDRAQTLSDVAVAAWRQFHAVPHSVSVAQHVAAWNDIWSSNFDMEPKNGSEVGAKTKRVIEQSLYMLYSAMRGTDWPLGGGIGGILPCYQNNHFWDSETWQAPNMALLNPGIAQNLMRYRFDRTAGAYDNARRIIKANRGIAFPWQSAYSGYSTTWWAPSKFNEIHITSDIIHYWKQLLYLGADEFPSDSTRFLRHIFPVLQQTADFFVSRSSLGTSDYTRCQEGPGSSSRPRAKQATMTTPSNDVHLDQVTGADEYHCGNDAVYTNFNAKAQLNFTIETALLLYGPSAVDPLWQRFHDNIVILYDKEKDYHPEFAEFNTTMIVKQADVVLLNDLNYPYETNNTLFNDLSVYIPLTDPGGPQMSAMSFAIAYLNIGKKKEGEQQFLLGYVNNTKPPNGWCPQTGQPMPNYFRWVEMASGGGCNYFNTGAGGFLQSVWRGLMGMRIEKRGIRMMLSKMHVPSYAEKVTARGLWFFQGKLDIELFSTGKLVVTLTQMPVKGGVVTVAGKAMRAVNASLAFAVNDAAADVFISYKRM